MANNFVKNGSKIVARSIIKAFKDQANEVGYKDNEVLLKAWANSTGLIEPFFIDKSKRDLNETIH